MLEAGYMALMRVLTSTYKLRSHQPETHKKNVVILQQEVMDTSCSYRKDVLSLPRELTGWYK